MSDAKARLVVRQGPNPGAEFILTQETLIIGRSSGGDVVLKDPEISRQHARLVRHGEGYALEDLGSTNGTFINQQRIRKLTPLDHGDLISFGEAVYLTYWDESATDSQRVPVTPPPARQVETQVASAPPPPPRRDKQPSVVAAPASTPPETAVPATGFFADRRRLLIGCGCLFLSLTCLCAASLFFLDAYDQGQLLYCGPLRPFWELILGPFGFAPACG